VLSQPPSIRRMSPTTQLTGNPNPENRPWRITKSPSATTKPGSYFKVGGAAFTSSNSPSRPGAMWALCWM